MPDRIRAVDCPSCGAPLELSPDHKRLFQCQFCGTTLEDLSTPKDLETDQRPKVIIHSTPTSRSYSTTKAETATTSSSSLGCWIAAMIIGIVLIGVVASISLSGGLTIGSLNLADQINQLRIYSFGPTQLLPSDNDTEPDVVGVTSNSDETDRMVYVDFDADPQLRWRSEPLGDGASYTYNKIIANESAIYMAYKTTLVAFDRSDGTILWQQEISDEVANICEDCLQVFEDMVVTLTVDGILTGFEAQTGNPTWNVRLNETTRQLINLSGKAGVLDEEDDDVGINVYAPKTGAFLQRIVPQCPNEIFSDHPQTLGIYDPVLISNDGKNLFVPISNYDPGCLQKWDSASLTLSWEASVPRDVLDNFSWEPYLLTDESLYLSDGHNLFAISLLDGSYQTVYSDEDHNLVPLTDINGTLLTQVERTRGTQQYNLWGIEITTLSKAWEFTTEAEQVFDESSFVIHKEGAWSVSPTTVEPVVLEAFAEPGVIAFSILDPENGNPTSQNSLNINADDFSYWMQVIGWNGNHVYLVIDGGLWWIDVKTGTEIATWP